MNLIITPYTIGKTARFMLGAFLIVVSGYGLLFQEFTDASIWTYAKFFFNLAFLYAGVILTIETFNERFIEVNDDEFKIKIHTFSKTEAFKLKDITEFDISGKKINISLRSGTNRTFKLLAFLPFQDDDLQNVNNKMKKILSETGESESD